MAAHQLVQELVIEPYEYLDLDAEDYQTILVEKTALRDQPVVLVKSRWDVDKDQGYTRLAWVHFTFPCHDLVMAVTIRHESDRVWGFWRPVSIYWSEERSQTHGTHNFQTE